MKEIEGGYFKAPNNIFELGLSPNQITVYLYLTRCANNAEAAFPGLRTIQAKCSMSRPTVTKVIEELEQLGLLNKERRREGTKNHSNRYTIIPPIMLNSGKGDLPPMVNEVYHGGKGDLPNKELQYKEPDYKEKTYIDFEQIDDEFIDIYNHHLKQNNMTHKRVTEAQSEFIKDQLEWIREQHDVNELLFDEVVIYRFANFPKDNDGDIRPFLQSFSRLLEEWENN